jgi:hypothetical protein
MAQSYFPGPARSSTVMSIVSPEPALFHAALPYSLRGLFTASPCCFSQGCYRILPARPRKVQAKCVSEMLKKRASSPPDERPCTLVRLVLSPARGDSLSHRSGIRGSVIAAAHWPLFTPPQRSLRLIVSPVAVSHTRRAPYVIAYQPIRVLMPRRRNINNLCIPASTTATGRAGRRRLWSRDRPCRSPGSI